MVSVQVDSDFVESARRVERCDKEDAIGVDGVAAVGRADDATDLHLVAVGDRDLGARRDVAAERPEVRESSMDTLRRG